MSLINPRWNPYHKFRTYFPRATIYPLSVAHRFSPPLTTVVERISGFGTRRNPAHRPYPEHVGAQPQRPGDVACVALSGRPLLEIEVIRRRLYDLDGPWSALTNVAIITVDCPQVQPLETLLASRFIRHCVEAGLNRQARKRGGRRATEADAGARGVLDILSCVVNPRNFHAFRSAVSAVQGDIRGRSVTDSLDRIRALARERDVDLPYAARLHIQPMDPRRAEFLVLRPFVEGCHRLAMILGEGQDDVVTRLVDAADGMIAEARGDVRSTRRYERQRDRLLNLSPEYRLSAVSTPRRGLLRFLDALSHALHPYSDSLEEPAGCVPMVTITTPSAAAGREWDGVIVLAGEEFIGAPDGVKNLYLSASRAKQKLLIIVPALRTAGQNTPAAARLGKILRDACIVEHMTERDVAHLSLEGNPAPPPGPDGGHFNPDAV